MKKILKKLTVLAMITAFTLPVFITPAMAQNDPYGVEPIDQGLGNVLGEKDKDPREIIGRFIQFALGFLGLIAVGIILAGGFKWMTSGGNEAKTKEAKDLMGAGVIGLIIILASWGIATWLINSISQTIIN